METESDYLVRNPKLITGYLTDILKNKCLISAQFGQNNASFLTAIIEFDLKKHVLKLDWGPSEPLNQQMLNSDKVQFHTEMDGIKISFSGKNIKKSKCGSDLAFEMPIPNAIFWMQRRQYYRVKVPLSHDKTYCEIALILEHENTPSTVKTVIFRLNDLSISGFSLLCHDSDYFGYFEPGMAFTECTLHLHEGSHSRIGFIVKNTATFKNTTGTQQRIGCEFTEITPTFESSIQRYIQDIERQRKNIG